MKSLFKVVYEVLIYLSLPIVTIVFLSSNKVKVSAWRPYDPSSPLVSGCAPK